MMRAKLEEAKAKLEVLGTKIAELEKRNDNVDFKTMIILAIATSIDALAVGITFAFFKVNVLLAIIIIGVITFVL